MHMLTNIIIVWIDINEGYPTRIRCKMGTASANFAKNFRLIRHQNNIHTFAALPPYIRVHYSTSTLFTFVNFYTLTKNFRTKKFHFIAFSNLRWKIINWRRWWVESSKISYQVRRRNLNFTKLLRSSTQTRFPQGTKESHRNIKLDL